MLTTGFEPTSTQHKSSSPVLPLHSVSLCLSRGSYPGTPWHLNNCQDIMVTWNLHYREQKRTAYRAAVQKHCHPSSVTKLVCVTLSLKCRNGTRQREFLLWNQKVISFSMREIGMSNKLFCCFSASTSKTFPSLRFFANPTFLTSFLLYLIFLRW